MIVNENTPKLRFPEFDDDWKKAELNAFASVNPKNPELPNSFIYIDLESVTNGVLLKEDRIFKDNSPSRAQRLLEKNDILYQTVRPYQKNNLYFDKTGEYVASTGYAQIRTKNDSKFLFHFLHTEKLVQNVMLRCTGTSYPSINSSDLSKIKISFPSLPEQQKIATFLSAVDDKIQQLSRKKELLEQYKKGLMQKIFTQELRFKPSPIEALKIGDEYPDWEEKKLGEVCNYKNGGSFEKFVTSEGLYNLISLNSIDINGKLKEQHKKVSITDNSLQKGDLIMVLSDVAHGNFLGLTDIIPNDEFVLNQRMAALKPKTDYNSFYLKTYINYNQDYFKLMGQGSSQLNLSKGDVENFIVKLPSLLEQQKIASFLSAIDEKIEKTTQQLTQTETFKKGLLQQLFV